MFRIISVILALLGIKQLTRSVLLHSSVIHTSINPTGFAKKINTTITRAQLENVVNFHVGDPNEIREELDKLIKEQ